MVLDNQIDSQKKSMRRQIPFEAKFSRRRHELCPTPIVYHPTFCTTVLTLSPVLALARHIAMCRAIKISGFVVVPCSYPCSFFFANEMSTAGLGV
jgi:hypothetical protein